MQEIEFRGFDLDLKKWIYGGYHKHIKRQVSPIGDELKENDIQHLIIISGFADWNMPRPLQVATNIDPKSIGQYTGLKDKNGKKIYGGDILKDDKGRLFVIEYKFGGFNLVPLSSSLNCLNDEFSWNPLGDMQTAAFVKESCDVIGNIYQNPELLEK